MVASSPGKVITLQDVATAAGVSVGAASFVLSGRGNRQSAGSVETRQRVIEAADELGYSPNRHAQTVRTGKSDVIVLELDLEDPWDKKLATEVISASEPHGLSTILLPSKGWYEFLTGYGAAAALITDFTDHDLDDLKRLSAHGVPIIAYGNRLLTNDFDVIDTDPLPAIPQAYHQLRTRHQRVSMLTHMAPSKETIPNRTDTFINVVNAAGDGPAHWVFTRGNRRDDFEAACHLLTSSEAPTAVIAATAHLAFTLQVAALNVGRRVPDELEIVSLGDVPPDVQMLGPVSYWGVHDVFSRVATIVIQRALTGGTQPPTRYDFKWEFFPGETTIKEFTP